MGRCARHKSAQRRKDSIQPTDAGMRVTHWRPSRVRTTVLARPVIEMVNKALSIFNPTAKDSMLAPAYHSP